MSIPAGTFTFKVRFLRTRPLPPQPVHLSITTLPLPPQLGQVRTVVIHPLEERIWPVPWQAAQVVGLVPGFAPFPLQVSHTSLRLISKLFSQPRAASSKVSRSSYRRSFP